MRLWSLHPSALDRMGLLALWREGLLAQKVLLGQTKGYRFHPQLKRFQSTKDPVAAIGTYLSVVADEADARGYRFDVSKIAKKRRPIFIPVTTGQMEFERQHLKNKLRIRDRARLRMLSSSTPSHPNVPRIVAGGLETMGDRLTLRRGWCACGAGRRMLCAEQFRPHALEDLALIVLGCFSNPQVNAQPMHLPAGQREALRLRPFTNPQGRPSDEKVSSKHGSSSTNWHRSCRQASLA